jgi:GntR family transcriptional regulator
MVTFGGHPAYLQVAEKLAERIRTGELQPGDKLPSIADLTRQYSVSKIVATMAIKELHQAGLIYGHRGKGTFVRERPTTRRRSTTWYALPGSGSPTARSIEAHGGVPSWDHESARGEADTVVALRLAIDEGDPVMVTSYVYRSDGTPIQLATSWEPLAITEGTAIELPEADGSPAVGVVDRFAAIGIVVDAVDETVSARMPSQREVELLALAAGVPVLLIERTYSAEGRPVETADIVVPADRYQLHYGIPVG